MSRSGAGWYPAADWQSASWSFCCIARRPINNRPQDTILPHVGSAIFLDIRRSETRLDACSWSDVNSIASVETNRRADPSVRAMMAE
jgi:hypothetical protein